MKPSTSVAQSSHGDDNRKRIEERSNYHQVHCFTEAFIVPLIRDEFARVVSLWEEEALRCTNFHPSLSHPSNLELRYQKRVLDVGCGGQPFRAELESRGFSYVSQDFHQLPTGQVDYVCSLEEPFPVALTHGPKFSHVVCTELLEHICDWHQAFKNLSQVTAPGGEVFITVPFLFGLHEEPYDFWRPTPHALKTFADAHGFDVIEQKKLGTMNDVMGSVLGLAWDLRQYHTPKNFWERIKFAIRQRVLFGGILAVLYLLSRGAFHNDFKNGALYISNSVRLKKRTL